MTESRQILLNILDHAQTTKSMEFRFITGWSEFKFYWDKYSSTKLILRILRKCSKRLFKDYCKAVIAGTSDVNKLFAYQQLIRTISFYDNELVTLKDMLDEYDTYLGKGHFMEAFIFGMTRSREDLRDFRKDT